jgi:hypothetical protein
MGVSDLEDEPRLIRSAHAEILIPLAGQALRPGVDAVCITHQLLGQRRGNLLARRACNRQRGGKRPVHQIKPFG